jgi:hypothetical protein
MIPTIRRPALLFFWAVPGAADSIYGQSQTVTKMAQAMTDGLAYLRLTDRQEQDVLELHHSAARALAQLKQKAKSDITLRGAGLFKQVMEIMQTRNKGLWVLLSPWQQRTFAQHAVAELVAMKQRLLEKKS